MEGEEKRADYVIVSGSMEVVEGPIRVIKSGGARVSMTASENKAAKAAGVKFMTLKAYKARRLKAQQSAQGDPAVSGSGDMEKELAALKGQVETLESEKLEAETDLETVTAERDQLKLDAAGAVANATEQAVAFEDVTAERDQLKVDIEALTAERDQLKVDIEAAATTVSEADARIEELEKQLEEATAPDAAEASSEASPEAGA